MPRQLPLEINQRLDLRIRARRQKPACGQIINIRLSVINRWRAAGYSAPEAAARGATERLRPELLGALIGVLALIPFLAVAGIGATVEKPLAAVVIGGIALSRPLAWFLLPTLYAWWDKKSVKHGEVKADDAVVLKHNS